MIIQSLLRIVDSNKLSFYDEDSFKVEYGNNQKEEIREKRLYCFPKAKPLYSVRNTGVCGIKA
jgi:hypothetical protein